MITNEIKKELFTSNLRVIEEIVEQLKKDTEEAKEYLNDKSDSLEFNLNAVLGTLMGMTHKLKQIDDMRNVLESINKIK